ncbi:MAG: FAD-binding oxidoreductase [Chloroflexi bacterium]|nr:FAD-binding oxidoreductase [Chloroflexota bacterium]
MAQAPIEKQADVVVVGGGIAGCATAYFLAKRGAKVVLVEKNSQVNFEQSSRNAGFVRQQGRHPLELPLMMECNRMWQGFEKELNADLEWVQGGNLRLALTESDMAHLEELAKLEGGMGLDVRLLSPKEVQDLVPDIRVKVTGAMFTPSDGQAEPPKVASAFARAAQELGARVYTRCTAEGVIVANRQVNGVATERGEIKAPVVVCAAGAYSSRFARLVGLDLPQRVVTTMGSIESTPQPPIARTTMWGGGFGFRQRGNGMVWFSAGVQRAVASYDITLDSLRHVRLFLPNFVRNRQMFTLHFGAEFFRDLGRRMPWAEARRHPFAYAVDFEPTPRPQRIAGAVALMRQVFPGLSSPQAHRSWAGRIDATPDAVPVLGEADAVKGFLFATGFSGHGFGLGPIAGRLTSELVLDGKPSLDIRGFRFSRFKENDMAEARRAL